MDVYFVYEFVEIVFVSRAKIDEGLNRLIWVCGDVLSLSFFDNNDHVVYEGGKVRYTAIDIGGLVYSDKGFVENCEKVTE